MLRPVLLLALLTHTPAYVTESPSFADRLERIQEKLEKLTLPPSDRQLEPTPEDLLSKIDILNSIGPEEKDLTDEDEELLSVMQQWGSLSAEQLEGVAKELQGLKRDEKSEKLITDGEYNDADWGDELNEEFDYAMDIAPDDAGWDEVEVDSSTAKPVVFTPSAFTRLGVRISDRLGGEIRISGRPDDVRISEENSLADAEYNVVTVVDHKAATDERPIILDDSNLTIVERKKNRAEALERMKAVVRSSKCLIPQPRWLSVQAMAPAADTVYMPPCVLLHRCAKDVGCCYKDEEECSPVDGKYVYIPFILNKADGTLPVARIRFYNHTSCACVARSTSPTTESARSTSLRKEPSLQQTRETREQREEQTWKPTEEPKYPPRDDEATAPPQLRRCTCPGLFLAKMAAEGNCTCVCEWRDLSKRRDCLSLARGREHFGLRDRVCVVNGDCNPPVCDYGAYDRTRGRCPSRPYHGGFRRRFYRSRVGF